MTSTIRIALLIINMMLALGIGNVAAQNLVPNGSFTSVGTDWTFFAPATGTEAYLAETSYGGTIANNIVAEVDMECNLRQTGIAVVPGTTYLFSFRRTRRTIGGAPTPTIINVKVYEGTNVYVNQDFSSNNTSWNWQCETFQFTPTGNTVSIDFANVAASTLGTMIDDVTITPVAQTITLTGLACQGGNLSLTAPSFPGDPNAVYSNYSWTGPNGFTAMGPTIVFSNAQPALNGNYICTMNLNTCLTVTGTYNLVIAPSIFNIDRDICDGSVFNFYGRTLFTTGVYDTLIRSGNNTCDSLIILRLSVNPNPDVTTKPSGEVDICIGDTLSLQILNPSALNSHQWIKNDLAVNGETSEVYKAYTSGNYKVAISSDKGCMDTSAIISLTVHELPLAQIDWKVDKAICINDTIKFTALPNAAYYRWSPESIFRNTAGSEDREAMGIIKDVITEVVLTAFNNMGCYNTDTFKVNAVACCEIFVPNAFSPNGDGINDYFAPRMTQGQLLVTFQIFDRWGKMVYQNTASQVAGWDGKYTQGGIADSGSYNYIIQYTCDGRANEVHTGSVTLIR